MNVERMTQRVQEALNTAYSRALSERHTQTTPEHVLAAVLDQPEGIAAPILAKAGLDVSTATVHRWLREGFITGEQITPGAPWQIRLTDELRARVREKAADGWLPLADAAEALGVARQTVLHKVQRGELAAVYVHRGKRKGPRIQVKPDQAGLFENHIREEKQC